MMMMMMMMMMMIVGYIVDVIGLVGKLEKESPVKGWENLWCPLNQTIEPLSKVKFHSE